MKKTGIVLVALAMAAGCTTTQDHHGHGPYAGQESRDIKALSSEEIRGFASGAGMGFAKPAELNGYPGPMHTLEYAEALRLTPAQKSAIEALLKSHKAEASTLGVELVRQERELDRLFAERRADEAGVDARLAQIAAAQAKVRASHLKAHLETTRLLEPSQIERYAAMRGYARKTQE
ncbi:hypothetical protein BWI17_12115 [Betaproteobacteria bacterium GR16-43]|nr:hypothetical protein BWI17_12115 [Betaproteobacteria bacterium GR16-43]